MDSAVVRPLGASELEHYLDHVMRLDGHARALRFAAGVDDHFVLSHCLHLVVSRSSLIGAFVDGALVGAADLEIDDDGAVAELTLAVEKSYRGEGLGRRLVAEALAEARRRKIGRLRADVDLHNEAMHRLLRSAGFRSDGGRRTVTYGIDLGPAAPRGAEPSTARWWNPFRSGFRTA